MQSMYLMNMHNCIKLEQPALDKKVQILDTPSPLQPFKKLRILRRIVDISEEPHPLPLCLYDERIVAGSQQVAKPRPTDIVLDEHTLQSRIGQRVRYSRLSIPTSPLGDMGPNYQEPARRKASNFRAAATHCHTDLQAMLHKLQVHALELIRAGWSHRTIL
jgi:hypothetical protein